MLAGLEPEVCVCKAEVSMTVFLSRYAPLIKVRYGFSITQVVAYLRDVPGYALTAVLCAVPFIYVRVLFRINPFTKFFCKTNAVVSPAASPDRRSILQSTKCCPFDNGSLPKTINICSTYRYTLDEPTDSVGR